MLVFKTLIVSDWHLGIFITQKERINNFLDKIISGFFIIKKLILNGDIFDLNWGKLEAILRENQEILKKLVKINQLGVEVIYILGNHDPLTKKQREIVYNCFNKLGVNQIKIIHGYQEKVDNSVYLITHGHSFDFFIKDYPRFSRFLDIPDRLLIRLDNFFGLGLSQIVKYFVRRFYDWSKVLEKRCQRYLSRKIFDGIIIGHTHIPIINSWEIKIKTRIKLSKKLKLYLKEHRIPTEWRIKYYLNSGDWFEPGHCTYISLDGEGKKELHYFR